MLIFQIIFQISLQTQSLRNCKFSQIFKEVHHITESLLFHFRFGERMSAVKKENEERTTRYLDKTSNGLVNSSHKIVSRKHILAGKSSTNRVNVMNRYSDTHGGSSAMSSNHHHHHRGPPPLHPMLDRNMAKHKRAQTNSEIMKRPLRYVVVCYFTLE